MDFEEMKVIWDSQNEQPLYAFEQASLEKRIRSEGQDISFCLEMFEIMTMLILLVMGVVFPLEPILEGHDFHQIPEGLLFLAIAGWLFRERRRRKQYEQRFDNSLLGDLDRSIFRVDVQIRRLRGFLWVFIVPMCVITAMRLPWDYITKPWWLWAIMVVGTAFTIYVMRREVQQTHLPRKASLQSLREKLAKAE